MVDITDRQKIEEAFHDQRAKQDVKDFYSFGALEAADEYLWASLGNVANKRVLEIGCGDGTTSVRFAKAGAQVTSIDISGDMVELTMKKAREAGVTESIHAVRMGGEDLDFPPNTFDIVYGHSVLHHLNLGLAASKIVGVLRVGGIAAFLEPLNHNPFLVVFRLLTPHRRTPTEQPLSIEQIQSFSRHFTSCEREEFYFISLLSFLWYYGIRNERLFRKTMNSLLIIDRRVFSLIPILKRFAWVTVVRLTK